MTGNSKRKMEKWQDEPPELTPEEYQKEYQAIAASADDGFGYYHRNPMSNLEVAGCVVLAVVIIVSLCFSKKE